MIKQKIKTRKNFLIIFVLKNNFIIFLDEKKIFVKKKWKIDLKEDKNNNIAKKKNF